MPVYKLKVTRPKVEGGPRALTNEISGLPTKRLDVAQMRRVVEAERILKEITGLDISVVEEETP